jgi:activator of HSP90 ATPase
MKFTIKTTINATAKQIYKTWLSTQGHTKMTGVVAFASDKVRDSFSAWDGFIKGKNLTLEPYNKIVQSWRSTSFNEAETDSQIEILLNERDGETELTLIHSNVPESGDHYIKGWEEHYFTPMKVYFELMK